MKPKLMPLAAMLNLYNGKSEINWGLILLSINLRFSNKYKKILQQEKYELKEFSIPENIQHNKIWLCWFQGFENAPDIVKKCRDSITGLQGKEVTLIDSTNVSAK